LMEVATAVASARCNGCTGASSLYGAWMQAARRCAAERWGGNVVGVSNTHQAREHAQRAGTATKALREGRRGCVCRAISRMVCKK
jgi:hypothetical protein